MRRMGLFRKKCTVGLEFDTGVIRAVELAGTAQRASVRAMGQVEIPEAAVAEGVVVEPKVVGKALERLWAGSRFRSREVVLGLSNQGVLTRLARFPKLAPAKLAQAVRLQSGEYFPIPMSQLVMDYAVVGEIASDDGPVSEVLLVAARRDLVDRSLHALALAGLRPKVVDASALALLRVLPASKLDGTFALVDIANGLSNFLVMSGKVPRLARLLQVSLLGCAREMGLALSEILPEREVRQTGVEELVIDPSNSPQDRALVEWGVQAAAEIRSSISYFSAQNSGQSVDVVLVSGRGARAPGFVAVLQEELGVPVEIISPPGHVKDRRQLRESQLPLGGPGFAVSMGLALRGLEE